MISRDTAFITQGIHRTSITNRLLTAARVHTVTQSQPAKSDKSYQLHRQLRRAHGC